MSTLSHIEDVMRELLLQGHFFDMKITCQGVTFKAHRAIVCTQSTFFNSAFCDGFKETAEKSINLKEETPETMERVLSFLYLGEYEDDGHIVPFQRDQNFSLNVDSSNSIGSEDELKNSLASKTVASNNIKVFIAADKLAIDSLKSLAAQKFSRWTTANWNSIIFPEIVEEAMTLVPSHEPKLQEIIANVISAHVFELVESAAIIDVLSSFGRLGSLVIMALIQNGQVKQRNQSDILSTFAQKLNSRRYCRQCSAAFNVLLENGEYQIGTYRCAACRTRH